MSYFSYDAWKLACPYDDEEEVCDGCDRVVRKCRCREIDREIDEALENEMRDEKLSETEGQ